MKKFFFLFISTSIAVFCYAQNGGSTADAINKIIKEEMQNSKVMDIAFQLTDVSGPRVTNSPGYNRAANWAKNTLASWGLQNAHLESWGEFGRGWELEHSYIAMTKPYYAPLIGYSKVWTGSTPGKKPFSGSIILIKAKDSAELMQNFSGKLKGKIVMLWSADTLRPGFKADAERIADSTLAKMAAAEMRPPANAMGRPPGNMTADQARQRMVTRQAFQKTLNNLYVQEKPALILSIGRGTEGTVFVQQGGQQAVNAPEMPASLQLSGNDYLRLQRLIEAGIPVEVEADVKTKFFDKDLQGYNVIAEIPGSDPQLKDEIVMLGGHLDSWQASTGATDNAAGCAVMMEAVRLIKSLNLQPRRTIRIALWSGEEQGIFGSRGYVKKHFADPATMQLLPEHSKISAYYNIDNGTGKIRGVYMQGNEKVKPIFEEWLKPFHEMGAKTLTINNTGGTDHLSFDAVGIPGFQFIQDPIEYDTRTHHSNMDDYDHLVPEDLKQIAAVVAAFVYNTAQRDEKLPRKVLPQPRGAGQRTF